MWWNFSAFSRDTPSSFRTANVSSSLRTASLLTPGGISKYAAPALILCVLLSLCAPNYRWLCRRVYSRLYSMLHAYTKNRRHLFASGVRTNTHVAGADSGARSVPGVDTCVLGSGTGNGTASCTSIDVESTQSPSFPLLEILVENKPHRVAAPASTISAPPESDTRLRCKLSSRTGFGTANGRDSGLVRNRSSTALFMV